MKYTKTVSPFIFLFAINSLAYEPEIGHKMLSGLALKVYNSCFENQKFARSEENQERVVHGDLSMDEGLKIKDKLSDLVHDEPFAVTLRLYNWHFYNPERAAYSKSGKVEQSHINLWNGLQEGFAANTNPFNKLLFLGGILHLTEDLTVPAHVVPVYHGPGQETVLMGKQFAPLVKYMQVKGLKYLVKIPDPNDSLPPDTARLESELMKDKSVCERVNTQRLNPDDVRAETVKYTLDSLGKEIPNCPGVTWQSFWLKPAGEEYFGRYNIEHGNPMFGEEGELSSGDQKCHLDADDSRYADFAFSLHLRAIESDMQVLHWASQSFAQPEAAPAPTEEPTVQDEDPNDDQQ